MAIRQLGFPQADVPTLSGSGLPFDMKLRFSLPADRIAGAVMCNHKYKNLSKSENY